MFSHVRGLNNHSRGHLNPSTDLKCLSRNPRTLRTSEQRNDTTDVIRIARPFQWTPIAQRAVDLFLGHLVTTRYIFRSGVSYARTQRESLASKRRNELTVHVRFDSTWCDTIHGDISRSEIVGETSHHALNSRFGSRIDAMTWNTLHKPPYVNNDPLNMVRARTF